MNIYFACSITGGREFESAYQSIVGGLIKNGHQLLTAHLAETGAGEREAHLEPNDVYARDVAWIGACDALIAEISVPSHGVGYEIGFALNANKPVLALYQDSRKVSKMITGNPDSRLQVKKYRDSTEAIELALDFLTTMR